MPDKQPIKRKLWYKKKEISLDPVVENYNAGEDIIYDQQMITHDIWGSRCYARLLARHNIINEKELSLLEKGLDEILNLYQKGEFVLKLEDEDCHTKIEAWLVEKYGDVGKKIHTGRSRNDQVLVMMRLFMKEKIQELTNLAYKLAVELITTAHKYENMPMPGYTHMQRAMPTSVAGWLAAFAESLTDDMAILIAVKDLLVDQNPLGSGAGYGSPFPFDRDWLSKELGFARTQKSPIYCQNSRGKIEGMVLEVCSQIMLTLNKLACDLLFYTTQEFDFFEFDDSISTGSSIMPQKKNLDVAELIRARTATVISCRNEMTTNIINKTSGYHRDGQELKRPLLLGIRYTEMSLQVMSIIISKIKPKEASLMSCMSPHLFAAHKAFELVKNQGMSFRDAYQEIGSHLESLEINKSDIIAMLKESTHQGGTGNLQLEELKNRLDNLIKSPR